MRHISRAAKTATERGKKTDWMSDGEGGQKPDEIETLQEPVTWGWKPLGSALFLSVFRPFLTSICFIRLSGLHGCLQARASTRTHTYTPLDSLQP